MVDYENVLQQFPIKRKNSRGHYPSYDNYRWLKPFWSKKFISAPPLTIFSDTYLRMGNASLTTPNRSKLCNSIEANKPNEYNFFLNIAIQFFAVDLIKVLNYEHTQVRNMGEALRTFFPSKYIFLRSQNSCISIELQK